MFFSLPIVQTHLGKLLTNKLRTETGASIKIDRVAITPFGSVKLKGVFIEDHHNDTLAYIKRLNTSILNAKKLINDGHPFLSDAIIEGFYLNIIQYKGEKETSLDKFIEIFDDGQPSSGKFRMKTESMLFFNSHFKYTDQNLENPKVIDFRRLNGYITDFFIKGPDVTTKIERLSFLDHRGLFISDLKSNFTYTKSNILLDNLYLVSPQSSIEGRVELKYERSYFSDFNNKVVFDVNFEKARIASNDLNYFYDEFGKDNVFEIKTQLKGTLNDFTTYDLTLFDTNGSRIKGTINYKNIFEKNKPFILKGNFNEIVSDYQGLKNILPNILGNNLPASFNKLGKVNLNGFVELSEDYIYSNIQANSALGFISSDLKIEELDNIDNAKYKGRVVLKDFHIGQFLNDQDFKKVSLNLEVDGKGFNNQYLDTFVNGEVYSIHYNNYTYKNIAVKGKMKMPFFEGYFNCNDPNLKMNFIGLVDLSKKVKKYNFKAQIDYADLFATHWITKDTVSILKGEVSFDADGNNLDDFEGNFLVKNISYQNSNNSYFFEQFNLTSNFSNDVRTIKVNAPEIMTGKLVGRFKIKEFKKIVENAVGSLYANYSPNKLQKDQFLDFNFTIYNKIIEVFIPEISISENTKLKGKIDADQGKFEFDFSSPKVDAFGNQFNNIKIDIDNKNPLYNTYVLMDSIRTKNYKVSDFNLINLTLNDTLFVRTEFKGGNKETDNFSLNLYHTIDKEKQSVVGFKKSEINIKNFKWFINENESEGNKIVFDKKLKNFSFEDFILSHNNQSVKFNGITRDSTYKKFDLTFHDVNLEKITPSIDSVDINGKVNGFVKFVQEDNFYQPSSDINVKKLKLNDQDLGDLFLTVEGNDSFNEFDINAFIMQKDEERFNLNGIVEFKENDVFLRMDSGFNRFDLSPFGTFLTAVFSEVKGNATGNATIRGRLFDPEIDGRLYLNDAGFHAPYLNIGFDLEKNAIVDVTENQFLLRSITMTDTKFSTKGVLNGIVKHKGLSEWELDLNLKSDYILGLNTKDSEDSYYYGTAFMKGTASITGPVESLYINVVGESEKGTSIKIPVNDAEDVSKKNYITFIKEEDLNKTDLKKIKEKNKYDGIELDLDFDIDTDALIEVILDRETGHAMSGRGYGSMKMEINTLGKFLMYGDFQIQEGEYNFKKAGLFDKKFNVKKGSTIRWEGDPLGAILNLEAIYETQANPSVLIESSSFNTNRKIPTQVSILINGSLNNPEADFNINFPTVSSIQKSEIDYRLQNKDVRQNQAFALLAFGSFTTVENAANVAYGSLYETASSLFTDMISDGESKLQVGFDYNQGDRVNQISDRVGLTLSTQINDKISINGKLGVPVGGVSESVLIGNVEIQMQLNEDGSLKARAFNRENDINYYVTDGIGYTQGIGLNYSVDFDTFKELWKRILTNKKKEAEKNKSSNEIPDSDLDPEFLEFINMRRNKIQKEKEDNKVPEIE